MTACAPRQAGSPHREPDRAAGAAGTAGVAPGLVLASVLASALAACDAPASTFGTTRSAQAPRLWALVNVSAGQTGFSDDAVEIRGLDWHRAATLPANGTFRDLQWLSLLVGPERTPAPFELTVLEPARGRLALRPQGGFAPDTSYLLAFPTCDMQPHIDCPPPTPFTTASAPRVLGLWRVETTLFVVFSEPMAPKTLRLAHGSVDLRLRDGSSVVATHNLSSFAWDTQGRVFRVGPLPEDASVLILGSTVRSAAGTALDVDGDGAPEAPARSAAIPFYPPGLPECFTREDHPEPCLSREAAAVVSVGFTLQEGQQPDEP